MKNIEIKRPSKTDFDRLIDFFRLVIIDTFTKEGISHLKDDIEKEIKNKIHYLHMDLESNGKDRYFLIALEHNQVIGTIEYGPISQLINDCTQGEFEDLVEVGTLFVHPDHQKLGIGTLLLNTVYLTLQSHGINEFCLDSGYNGAQKVWKKKFGEPDYLLKDYWGRGYDHMIWRNNIKEIPINFRV
ncbi:GNAT family N-acetyltransferase [Caldalkalibacillus mannanilyticus]|uniref:GNAT family N-acetyltransferase n=1 Tax=Caldalkalibacillus mannanilyticus TaxID=1418 RepID=UPI0004680F16|nr:GNAT family N-acetyltransferase [Caldalkalibacillus mannanilyticus]